MKTRKEERKRARIVSAADGLQEAAKALALVAKHGRKVHIIDGSAKLMAAIARALELNNIDIEDVKKAYLARHGQSP
jgi:hypothetical protein